MHGKEDNIFKKITPLKNHYKNSLNNIDEGWDDIITDLKIVILI